jgi:hypothetical protein
MRTSAVGAVSAPWHSQPRVSEILIGFAAAQLCTASQFQNFPAFDPQVWIFAATRVTACARRPLLDFHRPIRRAQRLLPLEAPFPAHPPGTQRENFSKIFVDHVTKTTRKSPK